MKFHWHLLKFSLALEKKNSTNVLNLFDAQQDCNFRKLIQKICVLLKSNLGNFYVIYQKKTHTNSKRKNHIMEKCHPKALKSEIFQFLNQF